jgi:tripartite-type tricarboxylate transporter receptor subunit TctC
MGLVVTYRVRIRECDARPRTGPSIGDCRRGLCANIRIDRFTLRRTDVQTISCAGSTGRMTRATRRAALAMLAASPLAATRLAQAQDERTAIRLLCGLAPGTGNDLTARIVGERLSQVLNRPVIVDNRPGAGQRLALGELRRAAPDGRTLALATTGPFVIYPHIYSKLEYDPFKDFTPIGAVASFDVAIASGPKTNAKSMSELVAAARANPENATFGSPGNGSLSHFVGIALGLASKIEFTHVPYKDSGMLQIDLAAGRLPIVITGESTLIEMTRSGRIRMLAVSAAQRNALLPEVPTLKESGINVSSATTVGIFGPAGLPADLVRRLNAAISGATEAPDARDKLARIAFTPTHSSAEALSAEMASEYQRFATLVKASGYVAE